MPVIRGEWRTLAVSGRFPGITGAPRGRAGDQCFFFKITSPRLKMGP